MPGAIAVCVDSCGGGGVDTGGGCAHAGVGPGAPALACGAGDAYAAIPVAGDDSERVAVLHCAAVGLGSTAQRHLATVACCHACGDDGFGIRLIRCCCKVTLKKC